MQLCLLRGGAERRAGSCTGGDCDAWRTVAAATRLRLWRDERAATSLSLGGDEQLPRNTPHVVLERRVLETQRQRGTELGSFT